MVVENKPTFPLGFVSRVECRAGCMMARSLKGRNSLALLRRTITILLVVVVVVWLLGCLFVWLLVVDVSICCWPFDVVDRLYPPSVAVMPNIFR